MGPCDAEDLPSRREVVVGGRRCVVGDRIRLSTGPGVDGDVDRRWGCIAAIDDADGGVIVAVLLDPMPGDPPGELVVHVLPSELTLG